MIATEVSVLVPARHSGHCVADTVAELIAFFSERAPGGFEILLIPNGLDTDPADRTLDICRDLARRHPVVRVVDQPLSGKGRALRSGFAASRGEFVFMVDSDLPYGLKFFATALDEMKAGVEFVTANRRLADSSFTCPVPLLPLVYKRHRLGLSFNRLVRLFFGIRSLDTQAGMKGMRREFAEVAFRRSVCPGFLADVEYFLAATESDARHLELPVQFLLTSEKSTVRLAREFFATLLWLPCFAWRRARGRYCAGGSYRRNWLERWLAFLGEVPLPWRERLAVAFRVARPEPLARAFGESGTLAVVEPPDVAGAVRLALECPNRRVLAVAHSRAAVEAGNRIGRGLENLRFEWAGDPECFADAGPWAGVLWYGAAQEGAAGGPEAWMRGLAPGRLFVAPASAAGAVSVAGMWNDGGWMWWRKAGGVRANWPKLTADDWGFSRGVNRGILELAERGVIRRVSLTATAPALGTDLAELAAVPGIELGLHWDLTSQWSIFGSAGALLRAVLNPFGGRALRAKLAGELERQLSLLEAAGVRPRFVDGHHHVHLLPRVGRSLREPMERRRLTRLRVPYDPRLWFSGKWMLNALSLLARRQFRRMGMVSDPCVYPTGRDWRSLPSLLGALEGAEACEIIVHPAARDDFGAEGCRDPYREGRVREFRLLSLLPTEN